MSARRNRRAEYPPLRGTVLFVHGLWMTGAESFVLGRHLATHGWKLRVFPYSSLAESMDQVARRCARMALALAGRTLQPVHLVGHSLGGLVIYRMFETGLLEPNRFSNDFCRVVFLGTPARGSASARAVATMGPARRLLGHVGERDLLQGLPARWPFAPQLGIIAGTGGRGLGRLFTRLAGPNDGTVALEETTIAGATDRISLPANHTALCLSGEAAEQVASFLETGRFAPQPTASR